MNAPELGGAICTSRGMPQDIRVSPDGKTFYIADMLVDGVHVVDGASFKQTGFIPTASARTASIPAATASGSTSPTAAPTR
jgi:DNA-binding beta-propeller fold protein YncE